MYYSCRTCVEASTKLKMPCAASTCSNGIDSNFVGQAKLATLQRLGSDL